MQKFLIYDKILNKDNSIYNMFGSSTTMFSLQSRSLDNIYMTSIREI